MNFDELTPEQKEKALACKTPEELLTLAKQEGYDLSEEQLEDISAGAWGGCTERIWKCSSSTYC